VAAQATAPSSSYPNPLPPLQDKLISVGERFPVVSGLLNAIRRKKSKVGLRGWRS
jgi:hypothetical protein